MTGVEELSVPANSYQKPYPMDGLLLQPGGLIGTSNEGTGGPVEILPDDDTPTTSKPCWVMKRC